MTDTTERADDAADHLLQDVRDLIKAGVDDCLPSADIIGNVTFVINTALRRLAAQDQEPVAWADLNALEKMRAEHKRGAGSVCFVYPDQGNVFCGERQGLFATPQKPQPAPGWDDSIITQSDLKTALDSALRTTPAATEPHTDELCSNISKMAERVGAEFVPDQQKINAFNAAHQPAATKSADAGGGVRKALENLIGSSEAFLNYFNPFQLSSDKENQWLSVHDDIERARSALSHQPAPVACDPLDDLVARFSNALLKKLKLAQANGRSGWEKDDWEADCQRGLLRHVEKGDPRDVAAYCAFMWHHGWITKPLAVDSNASAEARLMELDDCGAILERKSPEGLSPEEKMIWILGDLMNAAENFFGAENPKRLGHIHCAAKRLYDEVLYPLSLSAHPHASDCDKQGETGMNWRVSDETLRRIEEINENRRNAAINADNIVAGNPSDRTADVTKLLEFVVRADSDNTWSSNRRAIVGDARTLLDAYGMWRR